MIELCGLDATEHDHDWSVDFIQDIRIRFDIPKLPDHGPQNNP